MVKVIATLMLVATMAGQSDHRTAAARSAAARRAFRKMTGYPDGRPGYVIDHIIPLCAGGRDAVSNMQWEAIFDSYVKDKYERALCVAMKQQGYVLKPVTQQRRR